MSGSGTVIYYGSCSAKTKNYDSYESESAILLSIASEIFFFHFLHNCRYATLRTKVLAIGRRRISKAENTTVVNDKLTDFGGRNPKIEHQSRFVSKFRKSTMPVQ